MLLRHGPTDIPVQKNGGILLPEHLEIEIDHYLSV